LVIPYIRLVQEPGWFLNKLSKILRILQFLIGSCSETEVSKQLHYKELRNLFFFFFAFFALPRLCVNIFSEVFLQTPKTQSYARGFQTALLPLRSPRLGVLRVKNNK
jgi:hypothetical protein